MRRRHGTILTAAAVIAASIVLTSAQTVNAAYQVCCAASPPFECTDVTSCGECGDYCQESAVCAGSTVNCVPIDSKWGDCITVDEACEDVLCTGFCLLWPIQGEENTSEGDIASWPDDGLDEEIKDAASPMPLWILGLPKLLL